MTENLTNSLQKQELPRRQLDDTTYTAY